MPGETPSAPNTTLTAPPLENVPVAKTKPKIGRRLGKIPSELLFSPAGAVLIVFATTIEVIDWLSLGTSSVTGIALDAIFAFLRINE